MYKYIMLKNVADQIDPNSQKKYNDFAYSFGRYILFLFFYILKMIWAFFCLTSCVIVFFIYMCTNVVIYIFLFVIIQKKMSFHSHILYLFIYSFLYMFLHLNIFGKSSPNKNAHKIFIYHLKIIKFNDRIKYVQKKIININWKIF